MHSFADITTKRLFLWVSLTSSIAVSLSLVLGFLTQYTLNVLLFVLMILGYIFLCHMWSESLTLSYTKFGFYIKAFYFVSLCLSFALSMLWILFSNATNLQLEQAIVTVFVALVCHIRIFSTIVGDYASLHYSSQKPDIFKALNSIIFGSIKESIRSIVSSTVLMILSAITIGRILMTLDIIPRVLVVFPTHMPSYEIVAMLFTYFIVVLLYAAILLYILLVSQKALTSVLLLPLNFSKISAPTGVSADAFLDEVFFYALAYFCGGRVPEPWKPPAVPTDKFQSVYFSEVTLASSHSRNPTWSKILDHYIAAMDQVEKQVSPTPIGSPHHPYFTIRLGPQYFGWIYKLQALRDLCAVSGSSSARRNRLLQNENSWSLLLHTVCVFLGTLSIQFKLLTVFGFEQVIRSSLGDATVDTNKNATSTPAPTPAPVTSSLTTKRKSTSAATVVPATLPVITKSTAPSAIAAAATATSASASTTGSFDVISHILSVFLWIWSTLKTLLGISAVTKAPMRGNNPLVSQLDLKMNLRQLKEHDVREYLSSWTQQVQWKSSVKSIADSAYLREKGFLGQFHSSIVHIFSFLPPSFLRPMTSAFKIIHNYHLVNFRVLSPLLSRGAVYGIDAISALFHASLRDDKKGFILHYLPTWIYALTDLHLSLQYYRIMKTKYYLLFPGQKLKDFDTLSPHYKLRVAVRLADSSKPEDTGGAEDLIVSPEVYQLERAVNAALDGALKSFRDLLVLYTFPEVHQEVIDRKIRALNAT